MSVFSLSRCHISICNSLFNLFENQNLGICFKTRVFLRQTSFSCCHNENGRVLVSRLFDKCFYKFRPKAQLSRLMYGPPTPPPPPTTTTGPSQSTQEAEFERLLTQFIDSTGQYSVKNLFAHLKSCGLRSSDKRLAQMMDVIRTELKPADNLKDLTCGISYAKMAVDLPTMKRFITPSFNLVFKALRRELIIPDFEDFEKEVEELYIRCKTNVDGKIASYIPQLAMADPDKWAVSVCTIDGQMASFGDVDVHYTIQSCSKPFVYGIALERLGRDEVHQYVGKEPSGRGFNELVLNPEGLPHNPMINSGAIIVCSLLNTLIRDKLKQPLHISVKFDMLLNYFKRLAGAHVGFSNSVYLSEKQAADRNYALAYYMKENKQVGRSCFPPDANFQECIDFYFMCCSLESNCDEMAVMAATLANGGVCPTTNEKVLSHSSVRDMLTLMYSCGMYDYSGEFAFEVGAPSKSGVSGSIIMVIPNKLGICCYSPRLDNLGNSARGIQFAKLMNQKYPFHSYDTMRNCGVKADPTIRRAISSSVQHASLMYAAHHGDTSEIRFQQLCGENVAQSDFHGRTALHVAATQGHLECVKYLLENCEVPGEPEDLWGRKPLDEAERFGHPMVAKFIKEWISGNRNGQNSGKT